MAQTMSALWLPGLQAGSVTTISWAEVWSGLGGNWLATLSLEGGSVTDDWTNAIRRQAQALTLTDPTGTLTPSAATDLLYPVGHELVVYSGIVYAGGSTDAVLTQPYTPALGVANRFEAARLGTFLMENVRPSDRGSDYTITLEGADRSSRVQRAGFTQPYSTDGVQTLDVAIAALLAFVLPGLPPPSFPPLSFVPPVSAWNVGDDPWGAAQKLAADAGYKLDFDPFGVPTIYAVTDPLTVTPSSPGGSVGPGYVEGVDSILTDLDRTLSNKNVPNWIIGIASGSDIPTPIRQDWQDTDVASPTYIGGGYPTTTEVMKSTTATTPAQVLAMVTAQGLLNKGKLEQVQASLVANAAHLAGDVLQFYRAKVGVRGSRYIFDRFTHQLGTGTGLVGTGRLVA